MTVYKELILFRQLMVVIVTNVVGSRDYFTEAFHYIKNFTEKTERPAQDEEDDHLLFSVKTSPNADFMMDGADACTQDFPARFSFLFKIMVDSNRSAVTLFEIEDKFSITLNMCESRVVVIYGDDLSGCSVKRQEMTYPRLEERKWHKIGLSFSPEGIELFLDCKSESMTQSASCDVPCREDSSVGILTPGDSLLQDASICSSSSSTKVNTCNGLLSWILNLP